MSTLLLDPVGGDAARDAARRELRRGEYHQDDPSVLERVAHWIRERLDDLLSGGPAGNRAFLIIVVIVVALAIIFALRSGFGPSARGVNRGVDADPLAPGATAADHRRLAEQLTAQGRRAEALREWLRAAVQTIEERGVLDPRPGRTGAAIAREAGPLLPTAADDLGRATRAFDEVWFGGREATDTDVAQGRSAAGAVRSARVSRRADASTDGLAVPW